MLRILAVVCTALMALPAWAQSQVWLQIEARPNQVSAEERARDYANQLDNVVGFRLGSGWFAIALGPYDAAQAPSELSRLRISGVVPRDAFVADGSAFGARFWPQGPLPVIETQAPSTPAPQPVASDETPAQARAAERLLTRVQREDLQIALRWEGFYNSTIDGAFGPGTRRAMSGWQTANGYEATGVLTSAQRLALLGAYNDALASLAMAPVFDTRAGIEIDMPTGLVAFDRYEAPFAHYAASTDDNVQVLLISQSGDAASFASLYEVLQSLRVIPLEGERRRNRGSFSIIGANDDIVSQAYAELSNGEIKGFVLTWPAGDEKRRSLAVDAMRASFAPIRGQVLPDDAGQGFDQRADLLAGLEIRRPDAALSGFFVDGRGAVLTAQAPIASCGAVRANGCLRNPDAALLARLRHQFQQFT
ncbi:MAG: peptidoglycan-binding domain-containing protein [Pseudomonadota bacterium]